MDQFISEVGRRRFESQVFGMCGSVFSSVLSCNLASVSGGTGLSPYHYNITSYSSLPFLFVNFYVLFHWISVRDGLRYSDERRMKSIRDMKVLNLDQIRYGGSAVSGLLSVGKMIPYREENNKRTDVLKSL